MFKYKVDFWDELECIRSTANGIVGAGTWGVAIERVRSYYGENNVISVYLEEWSDVIETEDIIHGLTTNN